MLLRSLASQERLKMFKFNKGDKVLITVGNMFTAAFGGLVNTSTTEPSKITDYRVHNGAAQYKVKGFTGWWNEDNLVKA